MTMHINLSPEMEGFIKSKVTGGLYGSATEVIRDALRRMQAEEARAAAWQAAIKVGNDELDRGESIEYGPKTMSDIAQAALDSMHTGKPMDPDVLP